MKKHKSKIPKYPLVSVVIPTFNSSQFIDICLSSVFKTKYPNFEVIVVDDNSKDETLKIIHDDYGRFNNLRVFKNKEGKLAAATRNIGFAKSRSKYIALLDHDVEVDSNWLKEMTGVMLFDKSIGIVQSKIFDINKRNILQCVGVKIFPQLGWVQSLGFGEKDSGKFDAMGHVVGAATGVLYKKEYFNRIGKFDEKLGINIDDLDLNWRMWVAGYKTVVAPKAITYHWLKKMTTRDRWLKRFWWEFHYSKMPRVFIKNYSVFNLVRYLPSYILISVIRGIFNILFRLNFSPFFGFLASCVWNIYNLPETLKERKRIQKLRVVDDATLFTWIFKDQSLIKTFIDSWLPIVKSGAKLSTERIG